MSKKDRPTDALPPIGSTKERDDQLAAERYPLGAATDANRKKKLEGPNRPST